MNNLKFKIPTRNSGRQNLKFRETKSAFTIIEILIVITIIGILTAVFLGSYGGTIEHAKVESSAQEIKSVLESLKIKANSGIFEGEQESAINNNVALCYGMSFDQMQGEVMTFTTPFNHEEQKCSYEKSNLATVEIQKSVQIAQISDLQLNDINIYFFPPRGEINLTYSNENIDAVTGRIEVK